MRDNDELHDIPPMVPSRDDVVTRQRARRQPDIVHPTQYAEVVKVSTWPVRIMLFLLTAVIGAAAYGAWLFQDRYERDMLQADRRISDLENRLAMVGDSAEETTANVIERVDFNFSEIDKPTVRAVLARWPLPDEFAAASFRAVHALIKEVSRNHIAVDRIRGMHESAKRTIALRRGRTARRADNGPGRQPLG